MELSKLRLREFLYQSLDRSKFGEALVWEERESNVWKLLYYRVQEDHRVFEGWNKSRCRKEDRKGTPKSFFNSALNYLKKKYLLKELKRDLRYRRFQFLYPDERQKQKRMICSGVIISSSSIQEKQQPTPPPPPSSLLVNRILPNDLCSVQRIPFDTNWHVFQWLKNNPKVNCAPNYSEQLFQALQAKSSLKFIQSHVSEQPAALTASKKFSIELYVSHHFNLGLVTINPLHLAIINKDLNCLTYLLKEGATVEGYSAIPPLTLALCLYKYEEHKLWYDIIECLLVWHADANQRYEELARLMCQTPILMACRINAKEIAELLYRYGAKMDHCDPKTVYPLTYAIYLQSKKMVEFFVEKKVNLNPISTIQHSFHTFPNSSQKIPCFCWRSPLLMAIASETQEESKDFPFVEYLLKNGANPGAMAEGIAPPPLIFLINSIKDDQKVESYVTLFLKYSCPLDVSIREIQTSDKCAVLECKHEEYLNKSPLHLALNRKQIIIFLMLLGNRASPNFSGDPEKPLIYYCLPNSTLYPVDNLIFLTSILKYEADCNKLFLHQGTMMSPLHYFLNYCSFTDEVGFEVVSKLLESRAEVALCSTQKHPAGIFTSSPTREGCVYARYSKKCLKKHIARTFLSVLQKHATVYDAEDLVLNSCKYNPSFLWERRIEINGQIK